MESEPDPIVESESDSEQIDGSQPTASSASINNGDSGVLDENEAETEEEGDGDEGDDIFEEGSDQKRDEVSQTSGADSAADMFDALMVDSLPALRILCHEVQSLCEPSLPKAAAQHADALAESVLATLARIDEIGTVVEAFKKDNQTSTSRIIPQLMACAPQVEAMFNRLDAFQAYLNAMEQSVASMERRLEQEEYHYGQQNLGGLFKSLISQVVGERGGLEEIREVRAENFFVGADSAPPLAAGAVRYSEGPIDDALP